MPTLYLKSVLTLKEIFMIYIAKQIWNLTYTQVNPKGDQSWVFIGRTDAEAEAPIFR